MGGCGGEQPDPVPGAGRGGHRAGADLAAGLHPDRVQAGGYLRLIGLGALIGIPAALVAWLFLGLVHHAGRPCCGPSSLPAAVFAVVAAWLTTAALTRRSRGADG